MFSLQAFRRALLAGALVAGLGVWDCTQRVLPSPAQANLSAHSSAFGATDLSPNASADRLGQGPGVWKLVDKGSLPIPDGALAAHASALVALPANDPRSVLAFWFAGDRESAPNVQIAMAEMDRATDLWSPARRVVDRWAVADVLGFGLRRLGNPVAWLDGQGRVHLFVVATGAGGWAAGRIVHLRQRPGTPGAPLEWEPLRMLQLSWLWNISYLVRTAPMPLQDGGMVLPVYFELARKFPVGLRFDAQGQMLDLMRIGSGPHTLQPALLPMDTQHWLALMRDSSPAGRIRMAATADAGRNWQALGDLPLENPDSSVATLSVGGQHLLVYNPLAQGRHKLRLAGSMDGLQWQTLHELEDAAPGHEYSYPAMTVADGSLWVSYTDQRKTIAWRRFAWVPAAATAKDLP
jgi:predicted neuraminidase